MNTFWAETSLTSEGWKQAVTIVIDDEGIIRRLEADTKPSAARVGILLPAPSNLHSHAFQRAMAGLSEYRSAGSGDSFWTWRKLMYQFVQVLTPEDIESIAALVQMEMLEAGYASVCEFHYLHHQADGRPYANIAETSARIAAAASQTGIGLTHLPVLYQYSGCGKKPASDAQARFINPVDQFAKLIAAIQTSFASLPDDTNIGVAPHSLRAASESDLRQVIQVLPDAPVHIHIAEQQAEIDEVQAAYGARPVEWLLDNHNIDSRWCLVHASHMLADETRALAQSGAVAGLCPITEANLGDGIFDGRRFLEHGGNLGIGSDSNIQISLSEELRLLEYTQRLRDGQRTILATAEQSTGRTLYEQACRGGAIASSRNAGCIEVGKIADLMTLDANSIQLAGKQGDAILDSYIFAGDDRMVNDVWSAGRHVVSSGQHHQHAAISRRYLDTLRTLRSQF